MIIDIFSIKEISYIVIINFELNINIVFLNIYISFAGSCPAFEK